MFELARQLRESHGNFADLINSLGETDYLGAPSGKWSAGQQLDHLVKSVQPVNLAFGLPAWLLRILFGNANRPSRTYDELVARYQAKLAAGGRAPSAFVPSPARWERRTLLLLRFEKLTEKLIQKTQNRSEEDLDTLLLPHPLLGKLTLREMLYFTIYHAQHHQNSVLRNLNRSAQ